MNPPIISFQHVSKSFMAGRVGPVAALEDLSFSLLAGEFVCIVGPSGCGKTTILRIAAGLTMATTGLVLLHDREVDGPHGMAGMVFQSPVLLRWRTALGNVMLSTDVLGVNRRAVRGSAGNLLGLVGLVGFENAYPDEMSGGMQQRVAIARALVHNPEILLMDEPFGSLDDITREAMNAELLRIWAETGKTTILSTHNIEEAVYLADRVIVLSPRPGRLLASVDIPLPRPRQVSLKLSPRFLDIRRQVELLLRSAL